MNERRLLTDSTASPLPSVVTGEWKLFFFYLDSFEESLGNAAKPRQKVDVTVALFRRCMELYFNIRYVDIIHGKSILIF